MSETTIDKQFKMILEITAKQDARLELLEKSVETLITGQNQLISLVTEMKTDVKDLKETVSVVVQTQEEQNDLFDTIARRSIEHETKIKKLQASKRII